MAVAQESPPAVNILWNTDGRGDFLLSPKVLYLDEPDPYISVNGITTIPVKGSPFPTIAVTYSETANNNNGDTNRDGVALFFSSGPGTYFPPVYEEISDSMGAQGLAAAVFASNGPYELAVANENSNTVNLVSFLPTADNLATFLPDPSDGDLATQLTGMQYLQDGDAVPLGPVNDTGSISPPTSSPPDYLGYVGLPFVPGAGPIDALSPGYFLSVARRQLAETVPGSLYQGSGSIITGWQLVDPNGNPMSSELVQEIFGIPTENTTVTPPVESAADLSPIDPAQPYAALNGAYYDSVNAAPNALTTWAEAFFNWAPGLSNYSPRTLIPNLSPVTGTGTLSGTLPGSAYGFPSDFNYTLTYAAETGAPPRLGTAVDLGPHFNVTGIVSDGATFPSNGGLDGMGTALSANTLPRSVVFNGTQMNLTLPDYLASSGPAGALDFPDALSLDDQTANIQLPAGDFSTLNFLGMGVNGDQTDVPFRISYTDGTVQTVERLAERLVFVHPLHRADSSADRAVPGPGE